MYAVPTFAGSRPGGAIAAAWAALHALGETGYMKLTEQCLTTAGKFLDGIRSVAGLHVVGNPEYNLFAFGCRGCDVASVWKALSLRGWSTGLQGKPPSDIHLTVSPGHASVVDAFVADLREAVRQARAGETSAPEITARYT